jgi:hypothetical protein
MRRYKAHLLFFLLVIALFAERSAQADPPDIITSYKFLPRLSSLRQTGGIAGVDWQFPVFGTYDFVTGFRYEPRIPADATLTRYAQFANVNAYGAHPAMDPGISLDFVFNLSELDGEPIYKGPLGLELYRFEGTAGFNEPYSRVELLAARLGRWMYLRGSTEAPCCDFFEYEVKGIAHQAPSMDLDEDGAIGADDLSLWQDAYGETLSGRDFLEWQRQHGDAPPSLAVFDALMNDALEAMSAASLASVPEPASACLLMAGIVCSCFNRRISL